MKEKVKALWKLCFDDSDQFIDMYFRLRYKSEINVVIESGNEVISASHREQKKFFRLWKRT